MHAHKQTHTPTHTQEVMWHLVLWPCWINLLCCVRCVLCIKIKRAFKAKRMAWLWAMIPSSTCLTGLSNRNYMSGTFVSWQQKTFLRRCASKNWSKRRKSGTERGMREDRGGRCWGSRLRLTSSPLESRSGSMWLQTNRDTSVTASSIELLNNMPVKWGCF